MRIFGCFRPQYHEPEYIEQVMANSLDTRQQGGPADLRDRAPERGSMTLERPVNTVSLPVVLRSAASNSQPYQQQRRSAHFAIPGHTTTLGPRSASEGMADHDFNSLTQKQKIDWLVACVTKIRARENHEQQYIVAGPRCLTPREAMTYALELAFESSRPDVQIISQQLLGEYSNRHRQFLFFGIPFDKIYLERWARNEIRGGSNISVDDSPVSPEIADLGKAMYMNDSQNVHNARVVKAQVAQLTKIRERVSLHRRIDTTACENELKLLLSTVPNSIAAANGLALVQGRNDAISHFGVSVRAALTDVWNYIRETSDDELRSHLQLSLAAKLREISNERPCGVGMIERLIDTPTAIDWSITTAISTEHLREEMRTMAGTVNNTFEEEISEHIALVRAGQGSLDSNVDCEQILTKLKRERFLLTADIEFGMLRGIDRKIVSREADRVFPEDIVV